MTTYTFGMCPYLVQPRKQKYFPDFPGKLAVMPRKASKESNRFPVGTPYLGPQANYDAQIEPEQLLRRIVYGLPAPLLKPYERYDGGFWGRLLDALANQHAVIVRIGNERAIRNGVRILRRELPEESFEVAAMYSEDHEAWLLMVYNRIPKQLRKPPERDRKGDALVDTAEVARVLKIGERQARNVIRNSGIPVERRGGRNMMYIKQRDLVVLANRKGRHRRGRITVA
jgi:hypothetical protein